MTLRGSLLGELLREHSCSSRDMDGGVEVLVSCDRKSPHVVDCEQWRVSDACCREDPLAVSSRVRCCSCIEKMEVGGVGGSASG